MYDFKTMVQAQSVEDAIAALGQNPGALVIAGGTDVLIQIREGKLAGRSLVSIHGIAALKGIEMEADGSILIRPLTTFAEVTESEIIQKHIPALGYATDQAGGPQLRHTGTLGGNICNGVTSADSAPTLLALNAELELKGPAGSRRVAQQQFYTGPGKVEKAPDELLVAVRIAKKDYADYYGHYIKYAQRNAMDIATLGCAVQVKLTPDKKALADLRLAFGVAAPTPIRCPGAEQAAKGQPLSPALLALVGKAALAEAKPRDSWRASKELRERLIYELSGRALKEALTKAGGTLA